MAATPATSTSASDRLAKILGLGALDGFGKPLATSLPTDDSPASARGRFKTPGLRNVEFTGPYFHNGGQATLGQVMEFYNRGGDFPVNASNGPDIRPLNLSPRTRPTWSVS